MEKMIRIHQEQKSKSHDIEPPEVALAQSMREGYQYEGESAALWWQRIGFGEPLSDVEAATLLLEQKKELPQLVSAVLERSCNLHCAHCLYQDEKSSAGISKEHRLAETIKGIVAQMPHEQNTERDYAPKFLSCGRILRPAHLKLFAELRAMRPDVQLGVIDNGTYTKLLSRWPQDFRFDWMDISVDGTEEVHNRQRQSAIAFQNAIEGLRQARHIVKPKEDGGRISTLLTLTNINARDIKAVADMLCREEDGPPLADVFRMTTMSPTNAVNAELVADVGDIGDAWRGFCEAKQKHGDRIGSFGIYRTDEIEKFARAIGPRKFLDAFSREKLQADANFLVTTIDDVVVEYLPLSIWTPEEFLIEADGAYRTAYEGMFTLEELRSGRAKDGRDTSAYTVEQLTPASDFVSAYEKGVDHYWTHFGKKLVEEERQAWQRIRNAAR